SILSFLGSVFGSVLPWSTSSGSIFSSCATLWFGFLPLSTGMGPVPPRLPRVGEAPFDAVVAPGVGGPRIAHLRPDRRVGGEGFHRQAEQLFEQGLLGHAGRPGDCLQLPALQGGDDGELLLD